MPFQKKQPLEFTKWGSVAVRMYNRPMKLYQVCSAVRMIWCCFLKKLSKLISHSLTEQIKQSDVRQLVSESLLRYSASWTKNALNIWHPLASLALIENWPWHLPRELRWERNSTDLRQCKKYYLDDHAKRIAMVPLLKNTSRMCCLNGCSTQLCWTERPCVCDEEAGESMALRIVNKIEELEICFKLSWIVQISYAVARWSF